MSYELEFSGVFCLKVSPSISARRCIADPGLYGIFLLCSTLRLQKSVSLSGATWPRCSRCRSATSVSRLAGFRAARVHHLGWPGKFSHGLRRRECDGLLITGYALELP